MTAWRSWAAYVLLALLVCLSVGVGDEIVGARASDVSVASTSQVTAPALRRDARERWHPGSTRVFVLLADSLRYETAADPAQMPRLARLLPKGVRARVISTRDAVTVPAIRAAFRGVERTAIFGFVTSRLRGKSQVPSLFTDLHADGRSAVAYSDGSFLQFGDDLIDASNETEGEEVASQNECARRAAVEFASGARDVAVVHLTYSDHIAHEVGVHHPRYHERFSTLDELVSVLDTIISPDDTFVVFGDHGHDETGRHAMGLDVPTFAFYRGPAFRADVDLGTMSITDHRYLLGWALELPMAEGYRGGRHPEALASLGALPSDYLANETTASSVSRSTIVVCWGLMLALAALLGGATVALGYKAAGAHVARSHVAAGALAAMAFVLWGGWLSCMRPLVHEPRRITLVVGWLVAGIATLVAARYVTSRPAVARTLFVALIAPLFLLYPTVYRYGAPAAMAPVWMLGALVLASVSPGSPSRWITAGAVVAALFPFKLADATNFRFESFVSWPLQLVPGAWTTLDAIALSIVFVRRARPISMLVDVTLALVVFLAHTGHLELGQHEASLAIALAFFAGLLHVVRHHRRRSDASLREPEIALLSSTIRTLALGASLLAFHALVIAPHIAYAMNDVLLASVVLTTLLIRGRGPLEARWLYGALALLGVLAAGWVSLGWTVHRLEWTFLYDRLAGAVVERYIVLLLPWIVLRYALPAFTMRWLLSESAQGAASLARAPIFALVSAKLVSLVTVTMGIGLVEATSDVYLEAVQETAIWLAVMGGVV